jgi:Leucine-rich repeat (LRR) protein
MMKRVLGPLLLLLSFGKICSQNNASPWEKVAPPGALVYTDLHTALKDAAVCYRLDLTGQDLITDKKQLAKIPKLANVMALKLGNNNLTEIPLVFLSMHGLIYMQSAGNPLNHLSDSLGMLEQLRFIEFYGTNFDTLPAGITGVSRLQSLVIASNKDTLHLPKEISSLSHSLTELRIYSTKLDTLPATFASLDKLQKLVLYKCGLNYFPSPVKHLGGVKELWLDSNNIAVLPRNISIMQSLTYLSLRGNRLTHIPSTICFLTNLGVLDLRGNPIDAYEVHCLQALLPNCKILF